MRVENDGSLTLHLVDLLVATAGEPTCPVSHLKHEARIAASYARKAGYPVTVVTHGQRRPLSGVGYFGPIEFNGLEQTTFLGEEKKK